MSWVERGFAVAIAIPFAIGLSVADADPGGGQEICRFQDPSIIESSGLVARDGLFATVNDSGDSGRVFVVDDRTCRTVGTTSWSDEVEDVEAVASYGDGLLVGDIGDNMAARDSVHLLKLPVGRGDRTVTPTAYEITYPGGARDAEALLVDQTDDQVLIASKGFMSGVLYAAPERLSESEPNRMHAIADIPGLVTDGAFFPDGKHFVLRTYSRAIFYSYPDLETVGEVTLPAQEQGEGIAVDEAGHVFLSSEGQRAPVLRLKVPKRIADVLQPPRESNLPPGSDGAVQTDEPAPDPDRPLWPWLLGGASGAVVIVFLLRELRPR